MMNQSESLGTARPRWFFTRGRDMKKKLLCILVLCALLTVPVNAKPIVSKMSGKSMEPTIMQDNEVYFVPYGETFPVIINLTPYMVPVKEKPERYDIVMYMTEGEYWCGRIIGMENETLEIKEGYVFINDFIEPEDELYKKEPMLGSFGPYQIPEDHYFIMGDNRNNSKDGRFRDEQYVSIDDIMGVAVCNQTSGVMYMEVK